MLDDYLRVESIDAHSIHFEVLATQSWFIVQSLP